MADKGPGGEQCGQGVQHAHGVHCGGVEGVGGVVEHQGDQFGTGAEVDRRGPGGGGGERVVHCGQAK